MLCTGTNLQRVNSHTDCEFSNASIFNIMEQFIQTVGEMEHTILFPSRLLDLTVGDSDDGLHTKGTRGSIIKTTLANTDLYRLYSIIRQMKVELLWSQDHINCFQEVEENSVSTQEFRHARSSSCISMHSIQSVCTSSDSESDAVIENDSGMENEDAASAAVRSFKRHLRELYFNIQKMTFAAEYLIRRYQIDIDHKA